MADLPPGPSSDSDESLSPESREGTTSGSIGGFGLYKFGRGYWVRVMTAVAMGILFMSGAAWAWQQLSALPLPNKAWNLSLTSVEGVPAVGNAVTFQKSVEGKNETIGSGVVETVETQGTTKANLRVGQIKMTDVALQPKDANRVAVAGTGTAETFAGSLTPSSATGIPVFERVYLQGAVGLVLVLLGCGLIYHFVGRKHSSVDFLIATDEEMRKVNWSTRKIIIDSTQVVVFATFLIAGYIFVIDIVMKKALFEQIVK